jgi:hypothetical protein
MQFVCMYISDCIQGSLRPTTKNTTQGSSFFGATGICDKDEIKSLKHDAALGASIVRLQYESAEIQFALDKTKDATKERVVDTISDQELYTMYRKIKEIEIQKKAVDQALNLLTMTRDNIHRNERIQHISKVVSQAIAHKNHTQTEDSIEDSPSAILLESFQKIQQNLIEQNETMDIVETQTMDIQADDMSVDTMYEQNLDPGFNKWKQTLQIANSGTPLLQHEYPQKHAEHVYNNGPRLEDISIGVGFPS